MNEGAEQKGIQRILVVDDNATVRELMRDIFRPLGYQVTEAATGREALSRIEGEERIDLALVDLHLPGISGKELLLAIKRARPDLPALIISGSSKSEREEASELLDLAEDFLEKPLDIENVIEKAQGILKRSSH